MGEYSGTLLYAYKVNSYHPWHGIFVHCPSNVSLTVHGFLQASNQSLKQINIIPK